MPAAHIVKIEDARTGQWLRSLDPVTDPIQRVDMGWTMGDWNQLDVSVETTALRGCLMGPRPCGVTHADHRRAFPQTGSNSTNGCASNTTGYWISGPRR